jgi:predicted alpha/beta-fold hydrolase
LLSNRHLQTILGFLWKGPPFREATTLRRLRLPDGDQLVLHDSVPPLWRSGDPIALLIHGMGGSAASGYVQRLARLLYPRGIRIVRIDLRGTGAGFGLARHFYHGGRSDDIHWALEELNRWSPESPLWVVGFSLGGNLALKFAGESAGEVVARLERVAAIAPPIDIVRCSELISSPRNRAYDRFFANQLASLARIRAQYYPDPPVPEFPRNLTIRQFDDLFTAPRCGFADALDYYRRASSLPFIARIRVPTLILTARDDPFVAVAPFENLAAPPHIHIEIQDHGGHLGFLGRDGNGGIRWAEQRIVSWLLQK